MGQGLGQGATAALARWFADGVLDVSLGVAQGFQLRAQVLNVLLLQPVVAHQVVVAALQAVDAAQPGHAHNYQAGRRIPDIGPGQWRTEMRNEVQGLSLPAKLRSPSCLNGLGQRGRERREACLPADIWRAMSRSCRARARAASSGCCSSRSWAMPTVLPRRNPASLALLISSLRPASVMVTISIAMSRRWPPCAAAMASECLRPEPALLRLAEPLYAPLVTRDPNQCPVCDMATGMLQDVTCDGRTRKRVVS